MRSDFLKVVVAAAGALVLAGCAHNVGSGAPTTAGAVAPANSAATAGLAGEGINGQNLNANGPIGGGSSGLSAAELAALPQNLRVHFAFNSGAMDAQAQQIAAQNAQFMVAHPHVQVRLEGNTDDRG
ncbi:peptidoglycan-associated lipoprotein, partial [Acidithiobacillus ferrooxidans]|nr:peptidoglycan-associated lipoprotein [Acidithiobacillus ferrooxidans]